MISDFGNKRIPAVDGLRGVAVLMVVLYHSGLPLLKSGYLGVDVFFVISGFVITRLILRENEAGTWTMGLFLRRRVERLLPALMVTIFATLIVAPFVMSEHRYDALLRSALAAVFWVSNLHFWSTIEYFRPPAHFEPLLHTWSLAVEEQFYLIWPLLLLAMTHLLGRGRGVLATLSVLILASVAVAAVSAEIDENAAHYLPHGRAYQFLLGAALCFLPTARAGAPPQWIGPVSVLALIALAASVPGGINASFTSGLAMALLSAIALHQVHAPAMAQTLGHPAAQWLGRRAYAIYLVHWPLFVLWELARDGRVAISETAVLIGLSIMLGHALHTGVERPFQAFARTSEVAARRAWVLLVGGLAALLLFTVQIAPIHAELISAGRLKLPETFDMDREWALRAEAHRTGTCNVAHNVPVSLFRRDHCATPPRDRTAWLVMGDSTAADNHAILSAAYPNLYFGQFTAPGCSTTLPDLIPEDVRARQCRDKVTLMYEIARSGDFDGVVLSLNEGLWPTSHVVLILEWMTRQDLDVVLVTHKPRFRVPVPEMILTSSDTGMLRARLERARVRWMEETEAPYIEGVRDQVGLIKMAKLACPDECAVLDPSGMPIYVDRHHLTRAGSRFFASLLREAHPAFPGPGH